MIRRTPDDALWQPWLFLSVATLALAAVVTLAAVLSMACGSASGSPATPGQTETPADAATESPQPTERPSPSATPTTAASPSPTPTEKPAETATETNGGPGFVDNSPEVACTIGAPLGQDTRVARDCVIGPLVNVEGYLLNESAAAAYLEMKAAAAADGVDIFIISGYRDFDTQMQLYLAEVAIYGPDQNTSAKPGHSEHQLGTTVDLNELSEAFGSSPAGLWLQQNAGRFGFRMSYPAGAEASTGYAYEPWHWRWWG